MKKILIILLFLFSQSLFSQSWTQKLNGITIWSLAVDMTGKIYAGSIGANSKIFRSNGSGSSWDTLASGNGQTIFSMAFDSLGNMFVANYSAGLLKSTNGGLNFTIITVSVFGNSNPQVVACGKKGQIIVGTNGGGLYRSVDTGNTFAASGLTSLQVVSLLIHKYNSSIIYAGVTSTTAGLNGFYLSTDYGVTFSSNLNPNKNIFGIAQSYSDLVTASTTTGGPVDKSVNGGYNWSTVSSGYVSRGIAALGSQIYLAGNNGISYSNNSGISFINYGITASCNAVLDPNGFILFAGVSGSSTGGVWVTLLPDAVNNNSLTANGFSLSQNYPNPFNPGTIIKYQLLNSKSVNLKVYDIIGREIRTLVNQKQNPGDYSINFDAENLPSGIYYYRITAGDYSDTKKMVLTR